MAIADTGCEVTFTGDHGGTYTISCDRVPDLRDDMVNTGNSTIYLYPVGSGLTDSNYPYIQIAAGHYPMYRDGNNYYGSYITNATQVRFNFLGNVYREKIYIDSMMSILIAFYVLVRLFKK